MRLFIGIALSEATRNQIDRYCIDHQLQGRIVALDNLHLTLVFLGEVSREQLSKLNQALDALVYPRFSLTATRIKKLRDMVIVTCQNPPILNQLHQAIVEIAKDCAIPIENRSFFPHVTVVRDNHAFVDEPFHFIDRVDEVTLFSSTIEQNKRIYRKITSVQLT